MAKALDLEFQALAVELLGEKNFGSKVSVSRNGVSVGTGVGAFIESKTTVDQTRPQLYTASTKKLFKLAGIKNAPQVGDTLFADKKSHKITSVELTRPNDVTIAYTLEVV